MPGTTSPRVRTLATAIAATLAIIDLSAILLLISGAQRTVRVGFRTVHPHDVLGAAQVCVVLWGIVVALGWRYRALRRAAILCMAGTILLTVSIYSAGARRTFPVSDMALIESYTLLATQGKLMVGPYSRFGWHHPGPLYFWIAAPFYAAADFKSAGLHVAVQFINASSMIVAAWVAARLASPQLVATLFALTIAYSWRARAILESLWNPHVPIAPAIALTVVSAAIAAGQVTLIPLAATLASFIAQTYVGLLPYAAGVSSIAIIAALATSRRDHGVWIDPKTWRVLNLTAWLLVILWSGPLADQMANSPGNVTRLWYFFGGAQTIPGTTEPMPGATETMPGMAEAFVAWGDNVAGTFLPGFRFNGGGRFIPSPAWWPLLYSALLALLLVPAGLVFRTKRQRFDAAFAAIILVALIIAFWSITRIVGTIPEYGIVWISAIGMLAAATVCAAAIVYFMSEPGSRSRPAWAVNAICISFAVAYLTIVFRLPDNRYEKLPRQEREVSLLFEGLRGYLEKSGIRKPLFRIGPDMWATTAGLCLQMQLAGRDFAVEKQAMFLFTDEFAADGTEDALVTIAPRSADSELVARQGNIVVAAAGSVRIDAVPITPYTER
jgi:hypothetical protein